MWEQLLDEVYAVARQGGITQAGHNVMLYLDDRPSVEVGVQVDRPVRARRPGRALGAACGAGGHRRAPRVVPPAAARPTTPSHPGPSARGTRLTRVRWEVYGDWSDDPAKLETEVGWLLA